MNNKQETCRYFCVTQEHSTCRPPVAYYHDFWAWAIFYIFPSLIIFLLSLYYSLPSNVVLRRFDPRINIRVSTFLYMSLGVFLRTNIVFVRRHYMQWCIGKI